MSDKLFDYLVPVRISEEGHVVLRAQNGGGYWVQLSDDTEVPMEKLDLRKIDTKYDNNLIEGLRALAQHKMTPYGKGLMCEALARILESYTPCEACEEKSA